MSHVMWTFDAENIATKRGRVRRVVKERYLRDDVACGVAGCSLCEANESFSTVLSSTLSSRASQYLLLTTDVVLSQMDVLEHAACTELQDIIVLESVAEAVKAKDMAIYRRLRALIKSDRNFIVFANDHHRDTYVAKKADEKAIERDVRAICKAYEWYIEHLTLNEKNIPLVYLANDEMDAERASKYSVKAVTLSSFVKPLITKYPELADLMAQSSSQGDTENAASGTIYQEHKSMSDVLAGIKNKRYFQGTLRCNRDHWLECSVLIHGLDDSRVPVLIAGQNHINRAMDGDVVAIELLPKHLWKKPSESFNVEPSKNDDEDAARETEGPEIGVAEPTLPANADVNAEELKPCGKVVGIIQRNWRRYCGSIEPPKDPKIPLGKNCLFVPVDRKIPKIRIATRQADTLLDKRIVVSIDSWPADSRFPIGHYVRTLGTIGDKETETQVLLLEHDIPCEAFSDKVLKCLPPADWCITPENSKGRTDLRHLPVMSIDPPNCKDIDDALHVRPLDNGHVEIGVHIADVTHFVEAGSALDLEAADRGTSTYLVDKRLDMLPGYLTTQLCSLTDVEDHFAFTVLWEVRVEGKEVHVIDVKFCKSIIRSIASLSYGEAQVLLDDPNAGKSFALTGKSPANQDKKVIMGSAIKTMHDIALRLKAKRIDAGALTLASPEVRFVLDNETQNPLDVQMYALKDTNALVEEFMLLANITVAKKILRSFPTFSMLRRHPAPSKRQFDAIVSQAKAVGVTLRVDNSKQLQESLDSTAAMREDNPYFNKMLRILCTRCMMPASYFSSGEVSVEEYHHYGLAAPIYTHFTSPIRRYADVVVHRLLAAAIGVAPLPEYLEDKAHLQELSQGLNRRHLAAQLAGRASVSLHTLLYFANNPTVTDAMINKVRGNGIGVLLPRFGIEGMVLLCEKGKEKESLRHDPKQHSLTMLHAKPVRTLKVFQKVRVKVYVELTYGNRQQLKFELMAPEKSTSKANLPTAKRTKTN
ncbi:exosome complex exonuclease RRP44 [Thraustotheca clavata]|uniref:Exosome complex exonuclease RRP44 n=1 Tax=Thraustotheca clavata TaxID=74557 RepID=A0A1V9ZEG0_9STRA|nr:exosome complex exonuclease RRP44 [Thraustotheca clavata]